MKTKLTPFRLTDSDLRALDDVAHHLGLTRAGAMRRSVYEMRDQLGLGDDARTRFAAAAVERYGPDTLIDVEVTKTAPTIETRTLVDGKPATFHTVAAMDAGDLLAVFIGERDTDAALQIGSIPRRVGARLSIPVGVLPTLTKEK